MSKVGCPRRSLSLSRIFASRQARLRPSLSTSYLASTGMTAPSPPGGRALGSWGVGHDFDELADGVGGLVEEGLLFGGEV